MRNKSRSVNVCPAIVVAAVMPDVMRLHLPSPIRKHLSTAVRSGAIRSQKKSAACSVFRWKRQKKSPPLSSAPATAKMWQHDAVTSAFTIALPPQAADSPRGPVIMAVLVLVPAPLPVRLALLPSIRVLQAWTAANARPVANVSLPVRVTSLSSSGICHLCRALFQP